MPSSTFDISAVSNQFKTNTPILEVFEEFNFIFTKKNYQKVQLPGLMGLFTLDSIKLRCFFLLVEGTSGETMRQF